MRRTRWLATVLALLWTITCCGDLRADEAEKRAVRAIERVGGRFIRDEKAAGRPIITVFLNGTQHGVNQQALPKTRLGRAG
jgi:hypothetical protein